MSMLHQVEDNRSKQDLSQKESGKLLEASERVVNGRSSTFDLLAIVDLLLEARKLGLSLFKSIPIRQQHVFLNESRRLGRNTDAKLANLVLQGREPLLLNLILLCGHAIDADDPLLKLAIALDSKATLSEKLPVERVDAREDRMLLLLVFAHCLDISCLKLEAGTACFCLTTLNAAHICN